MLPILITAAISGVVGSLIGIAGTKESAGFGFIGMIGPISAFKFLHVDSAVMSIILIIIGFCCTFSNSIYTRCYFTQSLKIIYK